jgi:MFS family permease
VSTLRNRDFLLLWGGQSVSQVGAAVSNVALPLAAVLVLHANAAQMGILGAANRAPFLLVGLFAGVYADRVRRRPLLIAADVTRAVLVAALPALYLLGRLAMIDLYAIAFLVGSMTVLFDVAYQSYLPALVSREALVEGNSRLEVTRAVSQVAGPSLGGVLVQWLGAPLAIAANALTYVVSVLSLLAIRGREPAPEPASHPTVWGQIGEGLRVVFGNRTLWSIAGCTSTSNFFGSISGAVYVLYVVRSLHLPPALLGLVYGVGSVGALLGALAASRLGLRIGTGPSIIAGIMAAEVGNLLVPLAPGVLALALPILVAAQLVGGLGSTTYNIQQVSLRQAITPHRLLGRMNASMRFIVWGSIPLGSLAGGALAQRIGLHPTLWIGAAGGLTAGLWLLLSPVRTLRRQPEAA